MDYKTFTPAQVAELALNIRDLHALQPDDDPGPTFDVATVVDGVEAYTEDVFDSVEQAQTWIERVQEVGMTLCDTTLVEGTEFVGGQTADC